jgi:hypothetical protein
MKMTFTERMYQLGNKLTIEYFNSPGMAGELKFAIFDYEPKNELRIRKEVDKIVQANPIIKKFDLYEMMIELIKEEAYFDNIIDVERDYPKDVMLTQVFQPLLALEQEDNPIIRKFRESVEDDGQSIILIGGVGKVYPIIRSHTILNNLQSVFRNNPVVMLYPGTYDSNQKMTLRLFDKIEDDNYYRAFNLVKGTK